MHLRQLLLPATALAGAALLFGPAPVAVGFTLLGTELSPTQRDFRVFNNFTDASANNNLTPDSQFPGHQGAVMAIWKACVEWGSELHGNGGGDPLQPGGLGSGGANFDAAFAGEANGVGGPNDNIHSEIATSDTGVFAFCEGPANDGWRIRYHQNWIWSDGPTQATGSQRDIQGIATHEYGHALGLDHSASFSATMTPGTFNGNEQRTIAADDINGVKAIYGAKSASKPRITSVGTSGGTATIVGANFAATGNEVWFTPQLLTTPSTADPLIKATGVASTVGGTVITVAIPPLAGMGDVLVKVPGSGHATVSNAFPFGVDGSGPVGPTITSLSPSTIDAVTVGTAQTVTIHGQNFTPDIAVSVNGQPLMGIPSQFQFIDEGTITVDPPLMPSLGSFDLSVSNAFGSDTTQFTVQANATPALQASTGEEPVTFFSFGGLQITVGGTPGALFFLAFSVMDSPSVLPGVVSMDIGNNFTNLFQIGGPIVIGAPGWTQVTLPAAPSLVPLTTFYLEGVTFEPVPSLPLPDSNEQECQFLF